MANTYKWVISALDCYPEKDGRKDVVFTIHWRRQATDGVNRADIFGEQSVTLDPKADFTPYANLTEMQIIGWLEEAFGLELLATQIETLDQQIASQSNPPVVNFALPWA